MPAAAVPHAVVAAGPSHVGQHVLSSLRAAAPQLQGTGWNVSTDNTLGSDFIVRTPELWGKSYSQLPQAVVCAAGLNCNIRLGLRRCRANAECGAAGLCAPMQASVTTPGGQPEHLCVGHSDRFAEEVYRIMISAQRFVDVTSLTAPDGRFKAAIGNAITYLSRTNRPIVVRLLFASFPIQGQIKARRFVKDWTSRVSRSSPLRLYVGGYRAGHLKASWNHSKIVAADGARAMSGGHNLWAKQYLGINPVNDLSMKVAGSAAADAHRFVNPLWAHTCKNMGLLSRITGMVRLGSYIKGRIRQKCPPAFDVTRHRVATPAAGHAHVYSMGRYGLVDPRDQSNAADVGILAALDAARERIRIVQQDVGPPTVPLLGIPLKAWPHALFEALGRALVRGVHVTLLVSNLHAKAGGLPITEATYSNGHSIEQVLRKLRDYLAKHPERFPSGRSLDALLCRKFTIAWYHYSAEQSYPGHEPIPNHAKTLLIDDHAFYIGSQNLYLAGLTEHGFLVDHAPAALEYLRSYWAPLHAASIRTAVSGPEVPLARCSLVAEGR